MAALNILAQEAANAYDQEGFNVPPAPAAPAAPAHSVQDAASLMNEILKVIPADKLARMNPKTLLNQLQRAQDPKLKLYAGILKQIASSAGFDVVGKFITPEVIPEIGKIVGGAGLPIPIAAGVVALAAVIGYGVYKVWEGDQELMAEERKRINAEAADDSLLKSLYVYPD